MDRERRQQIKHDKFIDEVNLFYDEMRSNARKVVIGLVVLLVLIGAGVGLYTYQGRQETAAQVQLGEAITILESPTGDSALQAGMTPKYKDEAEKLALAEPMLNEVVTKHSGTDAADVAELYLARLAVSRGQIDDALPKLERFAREHRGHILAGGAQLSAWQLKVAKAPAEAIAELDKAASEENPIVPVDATLMLLAEAYEKAGQMEKSREIYQRVATEFPDSLYAADAQQKIAQS